MQTPILATESQRECEEVARRLLESPLMQKAIERVERLYAEHPQGETPAGSATLKGAAHSIATACVLYALSEDVEHPHIVWTVTAAHDFDGLSAQLRLSTGGPADGEP